MKPLKDYLNEITLPQIDANNTRGFPATQKRQHIVNTVNVQNIKFIPYIPSTTLQVLAETQSNGHNYNTSMVFDNVQFQEEPDQRTVVVHGTDNEDHNITPILIMQDQVKVDCTCADFRFRFAQQHFKNKSLVGNPPPQYIAKTNRPSVNPMDVLGSCKHILALRDKLRIMRVIR
jgi:hypothetical protein